MNDRINWGRQLRTNVFTVAVAGTPVQAFGPNPQRVRLLFFASPNSPMWVGRTQAESSADLFVISNTSATAVWTIEEYGDLVTSAVWVRTQATMQVQTIVEVLDTTPYPTTGGTFSGYDRPL